MRIMPTLAVLTLLAAAVPCAAQTTRSIPGNLEPLVGRELRIVDVRGIERVGTLGSVGNREVRLLVRTGELAIPIDEITRLDRRGDSLLNGTIVGMIWPATGFFLGGGQGYSSEEQAWAGLMASLALGGVIGAGIDALNKGWTKVYRADRPGRSTVSVAPVGRGVRVAYVRQF